MGSRLITVETPGQVPTSTSPKSGSASAIDRTIHTRMLFRWNYRNDSEVFRHRKGYVVMHQGLRDQVKRLVFCGAMPLNCCCKTNFSNETSSLEIVFFSIQRNWNTSAYPKSNTEERKLLQITSAIPDRGLNFDNPICCTHSFSNSQLYQDIKFENDNPSLTDSIGLL